MWQQEQVQQEVIQMPVEDLKELNAGVSAPLAIWKYRASLVEKREASSTIIPTDLSRFFSILSINPKVMTKMKNFEMLSHKCYHVNYFGLMLRETVLRKFKELYCLKKLQAFVSLLKEDLHVVQDLYHLLSVPLDQVDDADDPHAPFFRMPRVENDFCSPPATQSNSSNEEIVNAGLAQRQLFP
ncbi:hypothetical protein P9112_003984 [Eukaryota sp. TZLM1-RC]